MDDRNFKEIYRQGSRVYEIIDKCIRRGIGKQSITPRIYCRKVETPIRPTIKNSLSQKVYDEKFPIPITIITNHYRLYQQN